MGDDMRDDARQTFLDGTAFRGATQFPLPGDASFRRYIRLDLRGQAAMLMDAPPTHEDVRPFAQVARHLHDLGLSAPDILAEDDVNGFLLLEDFGDATFTNLLAKDATREPDLYALATDVLVALHALEDVRAAPAWLPPYDDERLLAETALLPDWFMQAQGLTLSTDARAAYDQAWLDLFAHVHSGPRTLVLRDYHVDNLMRLDGRKGVRACGLLDFQDALAGHPAYDLMSLLEDARRDVSQPLQAAMKDRYHDARGTKDLDGFEAAYAILAAQRHAKVIGIFTRLDRRDNKPGYLKHIDRLWRLLDLNLSHPALATVKAWFDQYIPAAKRCVPEARQ